MEESKELSPSQILDNKLEKYLSLSIYKNIYFIHIKFRFFKRKYLQYYLSRRGIVDRFSETNN